MPEKAPIIPMKAAQALGDAFYRCLNFHKEKHKEIDGFRELYDNKKPQNYLVDSEVSPEEQALLFRSGLTTMMVQLRASILTSGRPRLYCNPVFKEGLDKDMIRRASDKSLPDWFMKRLDDEGPEEAINSIVDDALTEWWYRSTIRSITYIAMKDATIEEKTWMKMLEQDGEAVPVHIPAADVCQDPDATTFFGRRYVFHYRMYDTEELENQFKLEKGSIGASGAEKDSTIPMAQRTEALEQESYGRSRAMLVEGYIKDGAIEGLSRNKTGIIVKFIANQSDDRDEGAGILVLEEIKNKYPIFPIQDYIPDPETEVTGRPIARDIAAYNMICDKTMQQGLSNFDILGVGRVFTDEESLPVTTKMDRNVGKIIPMNQSNFQTQAPQSTSVEGVSLSRMMIDGAQMMTGLNNAAQGRKEGRVESGEAYAGMREVINQRVAPALREWEGFLGRLMVLWGAIKLNNVKMGAPVRTGPGFRTLYKMPFALDTYIDSFDGFVGEDSSMPKDKTQQAKMILEFLNSLTKVPPQYFRPMFETGFEVLELEGKNKISKRFDEALNIEQQQQQAQQMIKQLQQQLQGLIKEMEKMSKENGDLKLAQSAGAMNNEMKLMMQKMKDDTSMDREQERSRTRELELQAKLAVQGAELELKKRDQEIEAGSVLLDAANKEGGNREKAESRSGNPKES
jgi:hypothetical protein